MERSSDETRDLLDDRPLMEVSYGFYAYAAIMVAHRLKLFPLLASGPQTLPDICAALGIKPRPAQDRAWRPECLISLIRSGLPSTSVGLPKKHHYSSRSPEIRGE